MTCSASSSSRGACLGALLALCAHLPGCGHGGAVAVAVADAIPARPRIALFPVQNLTGGHAPVKQLRASLEAALRERHVEIVPADELERVLAKHRIRHTATLDAESALPLREELGVEQVLIPAVEIYSPGPPPKLALTMRLVSTGNPPAVLWADGIARAGDDAPGLLAMGVISSVKDLEGDVVSRLAASLAVFAEGRETVAAGCDAGRRFRPRRSFRSPFLDDDERRSIAVLPFQNAAPRRDAGDVMVLEFVRQLARAGTFDVVEPGVVRAQLLGLRIILEGGVSLDAAQLVLEQVGADLVLSGTVHEFEDSSGGNGAPKVEFSVYLLDRRTQEVVWSSTSRNEGNDGVWFFGAGRVRTASALACRMTRAVVERMSGSRAPLARDGPHARPAPHPAAGAPRPPERPRNYGYFAPPNKGTIRVATPGPP